MMTDLMKKTSMTLALLVTALFSGGCSTMMSRSFPAMDESFQIGVSDKHAPEDDWAPGAYSLGKTNVCFAKTQGQDDANGAQMGFGLIGRAVAVGEMAGATKQMLQDEESIFTLDMGALTKDCLDEELNSSQEASRYTAVTDWKKAPLQVTPYAVFSFIDDIYARLWVVLRVEWRDPKTKMKKWQCRYLVGLGEVRPLVRAEDGWSNENGKLLRSTIKSDIHIALRVMFDDLQGKLRPSQPSQGSVYANWVFYKEPAYIPVQRIKTGKDWDVLLPQVDDSEFFAGVNIVPKDFYLPYRQDP